MVLCPKYNRLLGIGHKLISRRIKRAMFMSFKCSINFYRVQNDMSRLFVCIVALVIQGGAMAKFWPLHHTINGLQSTQGDEKRNLIHISSDLVCQNISLACPLSHELCKMVLSVFFSYSLPYIDRGAMSKIQQIIRYRT